MSIIWRIRLSCWVSCWSTIRFSVSCWTRIRCWVSCWVSCWSTVRFSVSCWTRIRCWVSCWSTVRFTVSCWSRISCWVSCWSTVRFTVSCWSRIRCWVSCWSTIRFGVSCWSRIRCWVSCWVTWCAICISIWIDLTPSPLWTCYNKILFYFIHISNLNRIRMFHHWFFRKYLRNNQLLYFKLNYLFHNSPIYCSIIHHSNQHLNSKNFLK